MHYRNIKSSSVLNINLSVLIIILICYCNHYLLLSMTITQCNETTFYFLSRLQMIDVQATEGIRKILVSQLTFIVIQKRP